MKRTHFAGSAARSDREGENARGRETSRKSLREKSHKLEIETRAREKKKKKNKRAGKFGKPAIAHCFGFSFFFGFK